MIWKVDDSTIWHWFGYWLGVFFTAYLTQPLGYVNSLIMGLLGSQIFWILKEVLFDKWYRKTKINWADAFAGWLFSYVFKRIINTQKLNK